MRRETRLSRVVRLDVGGHQFTPTLRTVLAPHAAGSWFQEQFSGDSCKLPDVNGVYVIDRPPDHFGLILNYLRDGATMVLPRFERLVQASSISEVRALEELVHEARFIAWTGSLRCCEFRAEYAATIVSSGVPNPPKLSESATTAKLRRFADQNVQNGRATRMATF